MASSQSPEALQIAQILADLNTLQNTSHEAAQALLSANKVLTASGHFSKRVRQNSLPNRPTFDALGRRKVEPIVSTPALALSRAAMYGSNAANASYMDVQSNGNVNGDEQRTPPDEPIIPVHDDELDRASKLVKLYEMRGKFQQMGDSGLGRAKERVDSVVIELEQKRREERERLGEPRY